MDKERIEEIALEVAGSMTTPIISDESLRQFATRFLTRIDAERGKEPVAWMSPGKERLEFSRPDTVYGSHTIPLYAIPPDAAAEIARLTQKNAELREKLHDESEQSVRFMLHDHPQALAKRDATIAQQAAALAESRANDRQGMAYLAQVRKVVGGVDFPDMVSRVESQSDALAKAQHALRMVGQCLAWQAFGECRSYGEGVPLLKSHEADALCKETLSAIDALGQPEGEKGGA